MTKKVELLCPFCGNQLFPHENNEADFGKFGCGICDRVFNYPPFQHLPDEQCVNWATAAINVRIENIEFDIEDTTQKIRDILHELQVLKEEHKKLCKMLGR